MSDTVTIKWKKLHANAQVPQAATVGAACFDITATINEDIILKAGDFTAISTGLAVEVPVGYELQIRARSGLAFKHGLTLVNGIGTIDSDYRGEIKVIVALLGKNDLIIKNGDRICQALVSPVLNVNHEVVNELSSTERGAGGFGSTGVSTH